MSVYNIVYSDIKGRPAQHLPITYRVNFRSFERASKVAKRLHRDNREVVIIASDSQGMIASWELPADYDGVAFEYNESRKH